MLRGTEPGNLHCHLPLLSRLLPCSKMTEPLEGIVFAGTTRDYSSIAVILDFFYPVATSAWNDDKLHTCTYT